MKLLIEINEPLLETVTGKIPNIETLSNDIISSFIVYTYMHYKKEFGVRRMVNMDEHKEFKERLRDAIKIESIHMTPKEAYISGYKNGAYAIAIKGD